MVARVHPKGAVPDPKYTCSNVHPLYTRERGRRYILDIIVIMVYQKNTLWGRGAGSQLQIDNVSGLGIGAE